MLPCELHGIRDVGGVLAPDDDGRALIDHAVVDLTHRVVGGIDRSQGLTRDRRPQLVNRLLMNRTTRHCTPPNSWALQAISQGSPLRYPAAALTLDPNNNEIELFRLVVGVYGDLFDESVKLFGDIGRLNSTDLLCLTAAVTGSLTSASSSLSYWRRPGLGEAQGSPAKSWTSTSIPSSPCLWAVWR